MPDLNRQIVDDWKKLMPEYSFMAWGNEHVLNSPIKFVSQALRKKHYAFVADYIRLLKVYEYGGFYLDTDMVLLKSLELYSEYDFVIGEQVAGIPNWAFFGSSRCNLFLKDCFETYHLLDYDQFKAPVIPFLFREKVVDYIDSCPSNRLILDPNLFYPMPMDKAIQDYRLFIKNETVGVHLWDFSWSRIKKQRSTLAEIVFRVYVLFKDAISMDYSLYYFRINLIRIGRLFKSIKF